MLIIEQTGETGDIGRIFEVSSDAQIEEAVHKICEAHGYQPTQEQIDNLQDCIFIEEPTFCIGLFGCDEL